MSHSSAPIQIRGFSLIELMIVIVLIGIMAGIAVPSFGGMIEHSRVDRAADRLVADISHARMTAVRSGAPVTVDIGTAEGRQYEISQDGSDVPRRVTLERDITVESGLSLTFNSRGLLNDPGAAGTIEFTGRRNVKKTVEITPAGRAHRGN